MKIGKVNTYVFVFWLLHVIFKVSFFDMPIFNLGF